VETEHFRRRRMMPLRVRAILWDSDGVLVDTEGVYFEATREVLSTAGVTLTRDQYIDISLTKGASAFDLLTDADEARKEALRRRRNARYTEMLGTRQTAEGPGLALPGVVETLEALQGRVRMAVVTGALREHFEAIHARTGLMRFFEFALVREDTVKTKPDPEPYLAALRRTGLAAGECVVVEDSARGVQAAAAAGLRVIAVPTELTRGTDFSRAWKVVADVREVPEVLRTAGCLSGGAMGGVVEAIYVAGKGGEPMRRVVEAEAVADAGLRGDRYMERTGYWTGVDECQVTLIEAEVLEAIGRETEVRVGSGQHRRNLVTRGIRLEELEGRRFRIGSAVLAYDRPRPPCGYIQILTQKGMTKALAGRNGGICARVVTGGAIREGDLLSVEG
jgi:HAD superfamily hydrolase (TIGR01509 family)